MYASARVMIAARRGAPTLDDLPWGWLSALPGQLGSDDARALRATSAFLRALVNESVNRLTLLLEECAAINGAHRQALVAQQFPLLQSLTIRFQRLATVSEHISAAATIACFAQRELTRCKLEVRQAPGWGVSLSFVTCYSARSC